MNYGSVDTDITTGTQQESNRLEATVIPGLPENTDLPFYFYIYILFITLPVQSHFELSPGDALTVIYQLINACIELFLHLCSP